MSALTVQPVDKGFLTFTLQSRVLRELGERLVKQPEVALLELIKNAYDADAKFCTIEHANGRLTVADDGSGMSLERFTKAWMTIGTDAKSRSAVSARYKRPLTGDKGIGRFAVRFLGGSLRLETIALDVERRSKTRLAVTFDWKRFDEGEDIGDIPVPFVLDRVGDDAPTGTLLEITDLRSATQGIRWKEVRTGALAVVSGLPSAMAPNVETGPQTEGGQHVDPGFGLSLVTGEAEDPDLLDAIRSHFVLRADIELVGDLATIKILRRGSQKPHLVISTKFENSISPVLADVRFFPRRAGTFRDAVVKGPKAYAWLRENSGVKVYDQGFRCGHTVWAATIGSAPMQTPIAIIATPARP